MGSDLSFIISLIISKVFPPLTFHSGMWGEKTKAWLLVMTPWPRWRSTRRCLQNRIIRMVTNTWRRISSVTARRRLVSLWLLPNQWLCPVCDSVLSLTLTSLWLCPVCDSVQSVTLSLTDRWYSYNVLLACEEGQGMCAHMLIVISIVLIFLTFPLSLCCVIKVVQVRYFNKHFSIWNIGDSGDSSKTNSKYWPGLTGKWWICLLPLSSEILN